MTWVLPPPHLLQITCIILMHRCNGGMLTDRQVEF
jgi:hypothetical protein